MAKNAGESRIPLPRTVRPSLLPKIRSLGPTKIGSIGHRRSNIAPNNKQQQQQYVVAKASDTPTGKGLNLCSSPDTDKDLLLDTEYSISAIWNATADNKEADHLMRLNDEKIGILRSQEDLASFSCAKKKQQQSREDVSCGHEGGGNGEYAIESPVAQAPHYLMLTKQNSFEHDESLGILTPDQMPDFTVALESSRTPSCDNLVADSNAGKFFLGKSNAVVAAAARHLDIAARVPSIEALISTNDRSPSLEELPLDPQPVVIVNEDVDLENTYCTELADETILKKPEEEAADLSSKTLPADSTESSEQSSEQARCVVSCAHVLPTSFITSITSITSLEAGYQGDGENSRPASRGPEPLSIAPPVNLIVGATCRQDPMTDSDFFTESDADAHEEIVRGDRRAQVIDGTLFCAPGERRCPSFEPGEEMDSSGIYSDLDKRQDVDVDADQNEGYGDGDHTTTDTGDTEISMRSQPSPQDKTPISALVNKNMLTPQDILNETTDSNCTISTGEVTVIKCQKNEQNTATKSKSNSISNKENSAPLKKYKMPKRNVISKIKTMIESNQNIAAKEEPEGDSRRPQRQQRKNGRWDAVMNKIEANKQRGRSLKKEVKSRVLQGLGTSTSSTASTSSTRRPAGDANNNANSAEKRRTRARPETNSPNQETARSSVRSSASDLSSAHSKETLKRPQRKNCNDAHQPNNNQLNANINKSNLSTARKAPSIKSVQPNVAAKQKNATTNKVADRNNRPVAKEHHPQSQTLNNHNNNNNNNNNLVVVVSETPPPPQPQPKVETREQEVQAELPGPQEPKVDWSLKRAEDTVQALAITLQYFTRQLDVIPEHRLREDLEKMRSDWLTARAELDELKLCKANIEETLELERQEHLQVIESLREDLDRSTVERTQLEQSMEDERRRADCLQSREREHRQTLDRLVAEHEAQLARVRATAAAAATTAATPPTTPEHTSLQAEVESLRTVLEIRSQECSQLRSECDILKRELDERDLLRQKCEGLEARCEDLKAQLQTKEILERQLTHDNEVLMGSIHQMSTKNKRLSQKNEELIWRLRQKIEVVSVLQNQLTPQTQRLSKSLGPEHNDHPSNESNCSQKSEVCSMVKYMVEKGDSVSWTLDITESSDGGNNSSCSKSPNPVTRRYHESNGSSLVSRQSSLRLSMPRRTALNTGRARSNSVSVAESSPGAPTARTLAPPEEHNWSPSYNSTPLRRRNIAGDQSWSLTNATAETSSTSSNGSNGSGGNATLNSSSKGVALEVSTTDEEEEEEEEEEVGQRPQEAGGEAMISEETSASSSSEDDESSVSSGDIP